MRPHTNNFLPHYCGGETDCANINNTGAEPALAFTRLELALACRELTVAELGTQFRTNSSVTREVKAILKSIDLPSDGDDADGVTVKRPCTTTEPPTGQLYFLDFRSTSDPECVAGSLPRMKLIDSAVPVLAYYMYWECGYSCSSNYTKVANYELLHEKTGTCCDGMADWTTVEAHLPATLFLRSKLIRIYFIQVHNISQSTLFSPCIGQSIFLFKFAFSKAVAARLAHSRIVEGKDLYRGFY